MLRRASACASQRAHVCACVQLVVLVSEIEGRDPLRALTALVQQNAAVQFNESLLAAKRAAKAAPASSITTNAAVSTRVLVAVCGAVLDAVNTDARFFDVAFPTALWLPCVSGVRMCELLAPLLDEFSDEVGEHMRRAPADQLPSVQVFELYFAVFDLEDRLAHVLFEYVRACAWLFRGAHRVAPSDPHMLLRCLRGAVDAYMLRLGQAMVVLTQRVLDTDSLALVDSQSGACYARSCVDVLRVLHQVHAFMRECDLMAECCGSGLPSLERTQLQLAKAVKGVVVTAVAHLTTQASAVLHAWRDSAMSATAASVVALCKMPDKVRGAPAGRCGLLTFVAQLAALLNTLSVLRDEVFALSRDVVDECKRLEQAWRELGAADLPGARASRTRAQTMSLAREKQQQQQQRAAGAGDAAEAETPESSPSALLAEIEDVYASAVDTIGRSFKSLCGMAGDAVRERRVASARMPLTTAQLEPVVELLVLDAVADLVRAPLLGARMRSADVAPALRVVGSSTACTC